MRVLDLFSGTGGFSSAFVAAGDLVVRLDNDARFADVPHTRIGDVMAYKPRRGSFDVVVASPPCQAFSMAGSGKGRERWMNGTDYPFFGPRLPVDPVSLIGCGLVLQARKLIERIRPRYFFIENPQGGLQTMGFMDDLPRVRVTYCQYGEARMKPTTIFGSFPASWKPRRGCKNGDSCHVEARRGARTGTQGLKGAVARAAVPSPLSNEIREAVVA